MTWSPYTSILPIDKVGDFFEAAIENYLSKEPKNAHGQIFYRDYFFEVSLSKANI